MCWFKGILIFHIFGSVQKSINKSINGLEIKGNKSIQKNIPLKRFSPINTGDDKLLTWLTTCYKNPLFLTHNQVVPGSSPGGTTSSRKPTPLGVGFCISGRESSLLELSKGNAKSALR